MTLKQFRKKVSKDYNELVKLGGQDWKYFLDNAYRFAHYNEIDDFANVHMDNDVWNEDGWDKITGEVKNDVNIVEGIYDSWLDYNHPEYYNFFSYDDFYDIVKYYFKHNY